MRTPGKRRLIQNVLGVLGWCALLVMILSDLRMFGWGRAPSSSSSGNASGSSLEEPGSPGPPPTSPAPRNAPVFANRFTSDHFELATDSDLPLYDLAPLAEETHQRMRDWLGMPSVEVGSQPRFEIYLCKSLDTIHQLEVHHGLTMSKGKNRTFEFRGGCYAGVGMIAIQASPLSDARWNITHEVSHAVFDEFVGMQSAEPIDEGLAEIVAHWIILQGEGSPETQTVNDLRSGYADDCGRAFVNREVPSLERFFRLDYWQFRAEEVGERNYGLSWSLVKLLLESKDPAVAGRFKRFLDALRAKRRTWLAFTNVYDVRAVEPLWLSEIESWAQWKPTFGDWLEKPGALCGTAARGTVSCILSKSAPVAGRAFDIGFEMNDLPASQLAIGFVLGYRSAQEFVYVEWIADEGRLRILHREKDTWSETIELALLAGTALLDQRIVMRCEPGGLMKIFVGQREAARYEVGERVYRGAFGLMIGSQQRGANGSSKGTFEFQDVVVSH